MTYIWNQGGVTIVGNADKNISPYLKAWIKQGNTCVVGVIGEGTSKEVQANWNSPFENDTIGGKFEKIGGLIQEKTDATSKTLLSSAQIWEGNRPHVFNLVLKLYALADAKKEVMDALRYLEKFASPNVNEMAPFEIHAGGLKFGRRPAPVSINIGRTALYTPCLIAGMTQPLDKEKTKDGHLVRCEVNLQIETSRMLNRSEIDRTYG
ncbi:conserved uncharacterized protein, PmgG [Desulfosarcina variabilis str. Montpellier]|uniref:hypothetical protein n=1 Tax=Desulfosarcina variabilis TaxID=2300 RepID=UPI003AFB15C2